jgi:tetratricopeptide (TPR) repeat protein
MARAVATIESEEVRNALARQLPASINIQIGGVQPLLGLLNTYPDEGATWDYYIKIANLLLVSGDAMRAGRAVDKAGTFPDADSKVVALSGADVLRRLGRHNEAAEMLLKAKTDENAADLLKKSALIYAELRDNEKLLDTVRNLSGLDPSNEWLKLMEKSVAAFAAEDIVTAKEFSDNAIEAGADAEFAFHHALWLDLLADDKIKGVEHADAALRLNALNTFANYIKATAFMRAKQYQEAERHFQLSISQNAPWFVVNDYAVLAAETGRFDLAEMLARNAIAAGGGSQASAWDTLGTALAGAGKKKEALEALQKAMTLPGADDPRIQLSFAELSLESGDRESAEKAIPVIDKGVELLSIAERERLGKLRRSLESGKP